MALQALEQLSDTEFQSFVDSFDTVVTDCDCVLWLDDASLPGSPETINRLKQMGKNIIYMTNNSTKTRDQYLEKCLQLGFNAEKEEILGTAYLAALYLQQLGFKKKAYIVGPQALAVELAEVNIESFGCGPDVIHTDVRTFWKSVELEDCVGAVVVGYDEHISYPKMVKALAYLQDPQCLFLATNNDPTKKSTNPSLKLPGAGCMVEAVRVSAKRDPVFMGKPDQFMQTIILGNSKVNPSRTLMIGDKPSTDILLGRRCGFTTLMVLSGTTTLEEVQQWKASGDPTWLDMVPDYYIPTLGNLLPMLQVH